MTTTPDRPYHAATFTDKAEARLQLWRKTSTPEVYLTVTDYEAKVSVSFSLNRRDLDRLITSLQLESELLAAPAVGDRRRAPADHPRRAGCEAILIEATPPGIPRVCRWFVYRGSAAGLWLTDAGVADWVVIE